MSRPRSLARTALTIAAALCAVAAGTCYVVCAAKDREAVTQVAATFAKPEFAALPTESLSRLGDTAEWDAHDLRTFSFVSAVLSSEELPQGAASARETVRTALLAGDYPAALAAVRSVQAEYDTLRRSETQGTR